jgi:predicted glycosyltransferase
VRILFDILHPAHVHVFRNLARELERRGHEFTVALREKDVARDLLDHYGFSYRILSNKQTGVALAAELVTRGARLWQLAAEFRPHFLTGIMGPSIAPVGRLRRLAARDRARVAVFYDTEIATITNSFVYPLADYVCTPDCYQGRVLGNHLTYPGYHELAYLHPTRFTPDPNVVSAAGVDPTSPYFVVRFVSYEASHDIGTKGLTLARKLELVRALSERGRVIVSSESPLPSEFEPYRVNVPLHDIHHFIAFARLLVGESATMASEAAVLGVPAIYVSPLGRGYTDDEERRYGLVQNFTGSRFHADIAAAARTLADDPELTNKARTARTRLLEQKIDVTAWMLDFFEREYETHFRSRR